MADFVPSPPKFNLYWSDSEGNIDFKDEQTRSGMWEKKKEADGTPYWTGKAPGGRRFVMYPVVPREKREQQRQSPTDDSADSLPQHDVSTDSQEAGW